MKHGRLLLLLAVLAVLGLLLLIRAKSRYESFASRQPPYFAEVAHACDAILREHLAITNRFLKLIGNEPWLPHAVLGLHADEVRVYPNRVWIGFDAEENSFAVLWEAQSDDPKSWALMTDFDGKLKRVYVEQKRRAHGLQISHTRSDR